MPKKSRSRFNPFLIILPVVFVAVFIILYWWDESTRITVISDNSTMTTQTPIPSAKSDYELKLEAYNEALAQRQADFTVMQGQVQKYVADHNLHLLLDLQGDESENWLVNENEVNNGLSSIKIYIMVAVYTQLDSGKLKMSTHVARYGFSGTVQSALNYMVHESSNEASGALIQAVGGVKVVNDIIKQYLGSSMHFHLAHTPGYMEGGSNTVVMSEETKIMDLLQKGQIVDADDSKAMLDLMYGTDDYYTLITLPGIKAIAQKIADAPDVQFGVVARIDTTSGRSYILAMQIWSNSKKSIAKSNLRDIIGIMQVYFNQPPLIKP